MNLWTGTNLDEEEDTIPLEGKEAFGTDVGRVAKGAFYLGLPRSVLWDGKATLLVATQRIEKCVSFPMGR